MYRLGTYNLYTSTKWSLHSGEPDLQLLEPWREVCQLLLFLSRQVVVQLSAELSLVLLNAVLHVLDLHLHYLQPLLLVLQLLPHGTLLLLKALKLTLKLSGSIPAHHTQGC